MERILNVGCGDDTYGTDFVDLYPSRDEVKKCDVDREKLPFANDTFDEVYSKNVLEHLTNFGFAVEEMYRVLKPSGKLVLMTDNANYWVWSVSGTHLGKYEELHGDKEDRHYALFTTWHLENIAKNVGFKDVKVSLMPYTYRGNWIKDVIKFGVNKFLQLTPFHRMAFPQLKVEATK